VLNSCCNAEQVLERVLHRDRLGGIGAAVNTINALTAVQQEC
jgi:hypothetical protein